MLLRALVAPSQKHGFFGGPIVEHDGWCVIGIEYSYGPKYQL